jgi:hypothetical protein
MALNRPCDTSGRRGRRAEVGTTLAELTQCAIVAGDEIEVLRTRTTRGCRPLSDAEFGRFPRLLPARLG